MKESGKEKKENEISNSTRKARCYYCGSIGTFEEEVTTNVYKCKCGYESIMCPACGLTSHIESYSSSNHLCTKCKIVIRPGQVTMTGM